jgi:hypothetical protein
MYQDPTRGKQFAQHAFATLSVRVDATTVGVVGHREYTEDSIDSEFWQEVFGTKVSASSPKRIGEGQVGMNLRYTLTSDDATVPTSVVVKLASPDPTSRATGIGLRNYEREVKFYNEVGSSLDVRKPHCYFADWNEVGGDIAIVLEDMTPSEQGDQIRGCGIEEARLAVKELSRLHGPRWNDPTLFDIDWMQRRDAEDGVRLHGLYSLFKPGFLAIYSDAILAETGQEGLDFVNQLESLIPVYVAAKDEPFTVTHGDYRLDNLLFATTPDGVPCSVVDWQTPGHGNGIGDLAYFIGAGLLPNDRRKHEWELVDLYIEGIESYGHKIDHEWVKNHYRREAISGLVMAVIASQIVGRTERGDKLFEVMATRHITQGLENGALSLL